jgi:hypothetical protein
MWADGAEFRFGKAPRIGDHDCSLRLRAKGEKNTANSPARAIRIVPVGTIDKVISLRVQSLPAQAGEVVKQIETPRFPGPIMRRPDADREEKRVTRGNETSKKRDPIRTGRLDFNDPNQRKLSEPAEEHEQKAHIPPHWGDVAVHDQSAGECPSHKYSATSANPQCPVNDSFVAASLNGKTVCNVAIAPTG